MLREPTVLDREFEPFFLPAVEFRNQTTPGPISRKAAQRRKYEKYEECGA